MKKVFLFLLPVFILSCTEKEQFITLSDSSVTILYDGSKQLIVNYSSDALKSKTYNYSSSDSTVVSVSKTGMVSGVSIGTATIKIASTDGKYTDECNFTVSPKSTLYKEPYTVFGSTISTVKSKETRTIKSETTTGLLYTDTDSDVRYVMYLFENGKLTSASALLTETTSIATEVTTFLLERYKYLGTSGAFYFFTDRKSGNGIALTVDATLGLCVLYIPSTSSSSVQIQKLKKSNQTSTTNDSNEALSTELKKIMSQKTH
ncbi:MAG: Ig-like domain-containing protein [Bacteroidota bacterium]|nr:Ig-like domain-containing protein [Bacteroidota bacterium]